MTNFSIYDENQIDKNKSIKARYMTLLKNRPIITIADIDMSAIQTMSEADLFKIIPQQAD